MKIPKPLKEALEATGLPWSVERGAKHDKLILDGHVVCGLPKGLKFGPYDVKRNISQVRLKFAEIKRGEI